jgi:hypothetical protein
MEPLGTSAKAAASLLALAASVWGAFAYLDDHFIRVARAEERHAALYAELQIRDLETKLDLAELEMEALDPGDPEDARELERLRRRSDVLEKHLLELRSDLYDAEEER